MLVEIREILGTKEYMNQESAISEVFKTKGDGKKVARARKERRTIPRDRSRPSSLATVGGAGNQATSNKTVGIIQARNRRLMQERDQLFTASIAGSGATGDPNVTSSPTIPLTEGDLMAKRRKGDFAALERTTG